MIPLSLAEIAEITGGRVVGDPAVTVTGGVEFDSRKIGPGGLFVAFPGEKVDGHDFAATAVSAGAAAVLSIRETGFPGVLVDDPRDAMTALARVVAARLTNLTVVGVTGSSGKTTTKDLIGGLLSRLGPTVALPGSLNNELGFPYTVLQATEQTRFLVLEMGARKVGHVGFLAGIAHPSIGVVLNVGVAHLGEFGSVDLIAQAKGELAEALPESGVAVLNADDPRVAAMASRTSARVVLTGLADSAALRATDVAVDNYGKASYSLISGEKSGRVRLTVAGEHQVANSLAAGAVALAAGMEFDDLVVALSEVGIVSGRRMEVVTRPDGIVLIDDSYNANTSSTAAALRALAAMGSGRRTTAVLGYMAELGEQEVSGHAEVGRLAAELGVDRLIAVAGNARPILDGAAEVPDWTGTARFAADQAGAIEILKADLRADDVVLVKGSRYRTWDVADWLRRSEEV
ncbi:MAG TPA: UDP-N-acetylmuramoyl-tripeptide--D-alanyl-D-alanine ligase [Actinoplanes sp.]|nr:UDP-N-acetylmuramoyl-tripeptide--D-alanyl-D-alanine ligase [Actinoplanes sp.]